MNDQNTGLRVEWDPALIRKYDRSGPRYTSYPTADRFVPGFNAARYEEWLHRRAAEANPSPLSLYFHIPFCQTVCFYCACNKIVTANREHAGKYIDYLEKEIELQARHLGRHREVRQLHWGGGTPTFLNHEQMRRLMGATRGHFELAEGEYSIEIDPRKVDEATIALLREIGFNRMSLGVQDFDPEVQKAVNRIQSEEETLRVLNAARTEGFCSVSIDLIYGLPKQTVSGFRHTLDRILAADPDRISLYNYAHLPHLFKPQRQIRDEDLPSADAKLEILQNAIAHLTGAGYVYIGMDHFAKADNELNLAQREGRLQRNFQGYSTHADCDMVAMGVTAIGKVGPTYSQNFRTLEDYYARLDQGVLPIMRGLECDDDDLLRRAVIQALMCQFELDFARLGQQHGVDFARYFAAELGDLEPMAADGLLALGPDRLTVTPKGRLLIRNIAMAFDRYLRQDQERRAYSKVI
ncbi:oxygen-independent coproporphyrinogen III oxidase [Methylococcus mesophilus]|uniref:oxygen-independent coproporphyrinogen III oxidase n=1 Tax=Methylococcus mesophilus TaxID=2993564 RepID=UPI00224B9047|nr:oxygen-independent coproporphyrinogen III oxidase [Methylococcus mesophilus]UZR27496.1 oxygen-independent coproporphyrinogen III oxidase [Methylococcus mesophilus]